jgi:hypothetical protein
MGISLYVFITISQTITEDLLGKVLLWFLNIADRKKARVIVEDQLSAYIYTKKEILSVLHSGCPLFFKHGEDAGIPL